MATLKQKKAIQKVLENGGNVTDAMRQAGYSDASINNPKNLTKSKAFVELVDEYLPEDHLMQRHRELLDNSPPKTALGALSLAYDIKGSKAPSKTMNLNVDMNVDNVAIQQLADLLSREIKDDTSE